MMQKMNTLPVVAGMALVALCSFGHAFETWGRKAAIQLSGYNRAETLTNFPALVVLGPNIPGFDYSQLKSGRNDVGFTDASGTALNYEIESWDTGGSSYVWVQVPALTNGAAITMWWGAAVQDTPVCTTNGSTWANGYVAVWHLSETDTVHHDSAGVDNAVTSVGSAAYTASGLIGGGGQFPGGSGDYMATADNAPEIDGLTAITIEGWFKSSNNTGVRGMVGKRMSGTSDTSYSLFYNVNNVYADLGTGTRLTGPALPSLNQWHYQGVTFAANDASSGFILDGALQTFTSGARAMGPKPYPVCLGRIAGNTGTWMGQMDEVRISSVARTPGWIWASFMTQGSNAVFQTYGAATVVDATGSPSVENRAVGGVTVSGASLNGTLAATGSTATAVSVYWGPSDGETNVLAWASSYAWPAPQEAGDFSFDASGLVSDTTYYYTYAAQNAGGMSWADGVQSFITGALSVQATDASFGRDASDTATFTVTRPAACSELPMTAFYVVGGTASEGVNYTIAPSGGQLEFEVGQQTAVLTATPLAPWNYGVPQSLTVTLAAGAYALGVASNAVATLETTSQWPGTTQWWDTASSAGLQGGAGVWSVTGAAWATNAAPSAGAGPLVWADGHDAVFAANDSASTVTVMRVTVGSLAVTGNKAVTFLDGGAGPLTLNAGLANTGASVVFGTALSLGADQRWNVSRSTAVEGAVSGTAVLVKEGAGPLTFGQTNTLTGGLTVRAGSVTGAAQVGGSPFGASGSPLTIGGADADATSAGLALVGRAEATAALHGGLTAAGAFGSGTLTLNAAAGGETVLTCDHLARDGRATLTVTPTANSLGALERLTLGTPPAAVSGMLPPWLAITANGGDFAAYGANGVVSAPYDAAFDGGASAQVVALASDSALTADQQAYALKTAATLTLDGATLTLGDGVGPAGLIFKNGRIAGTGGLAFGASEAAVYVGAGQSGTIAVPVSGEGGLTKFGEGTLALSNAVALCGGETLIQSGTLAVFPAQAVVWSNDVAGAGTLAKGGDETLTVANGSGVLGGLSVSKGTLAFSGGSRTVLAPPTIASGSALSLEGGVRYLNTVTGTVANLSGTLALTGGASGALAFTGAAGVFSVNASGSLLADEGSGLSLTNGALRVNGAALLGIGLSGTAGAVSADGGLTVSGSSNVMTVANGVLAVKGLSYNGTGSTLTLLPGGVLDGLGGAVSGNGTDCSWVIDGGLLTNVVNDGSSWTSVRLAQGTRNTVTVKKGGRLVTYPSANLMIGGNQGSGSCALTIGGEGGGTVRTGSMTVGGGNDTGGSGSSLNRVVISNGVLFCSTASIGRNNNNTGGATMRSNTVSVLAGGVWSAGGDITVGQGNGSWSFDNSLTVDAGTVTGVGSLSVGSTRTTRDNQVIVRNGGSLYAARVLIGASAQTNNAVRVTSGGVLEAGNTLTVDAADGNLFSATAGGVLQFTSAAPVLTPNGAGRIALDNGSVSFRNVSDAHVKANWDGSLTNIAFSGANAFRLCAATNTAALDQTYVFDPGLGATHYARLELVDGATCYRGLATDTLTIGQNAGSGGEMLCSNTAATVAIPFVNNGTLRLVNSTLDFATNAVINGTVVVDLDRLAAWDLPLLTARQGLTIGGALQFVGTPTNAVILSVSGGLSGKFSSVTGLRGDYGLSYRGNDVILRYAPGGTVLYLR